MARIFPPALALLAIFALGPTAAGAEWQEVSRDEAKLVLYSPTLRAALTEFARTRIGYGVQEVGRWILPLSDFPRAEIFVYIARVGAHIPSGRGLGVKQLTKLWRFLEDEKLTFGDETTYRNVLGEGKYGEFSFNDHECVVFRQFWGMVHETRGTSLGTRMLHGYYCDEAGSKLEPDTIESILDGIGVRGERVPETPARW